MGGIIAKRSLPGNLWLDRTFICHFSTQYTRKYTVDRYLHRYNTMKGTKLYKYL